MTRTVASVAVLTLVVALVPAGVDAQTTPPLVGVIVQASPGTDTADLAARTASQFGGRRGFVYRHAIDGFSAQLPGAAIDALAANPSVVAITPDVAVHIASQETPTGYDRIEADLLPRESLPLDATGCPVGVNCVDVDIAVLDTGIAEHPDLRVVTRVDCSYFFATSCVSGGVDGHGHGTHVAGTIGAHDNDSGVIGVVPGARLHAVKVLNDSGTAMLSNLVAGLDWVAARTDTIDVVNMSLGGEFSNSTFDAGISNIVADGVVFAAAAGNSAIDAVTFSPANHPDVIAVSAVADADGGAGGLSGFRCRQGETDDTFATFSNYGAVVDIAAPGVCIVSTWNDGGYHTISGTSMAAPHVAGAAALYVALWGRDVDGNGTVDGADAAAVKTALVGDGHPQASACGFGGDPDSHTEPLLFVNGGAFGSTGACEQEPVDPTPPSVVTATAVADGYPVDVSWTPAEDAESGILEYRIHRDTVPSSGRVQIARAAYDATAYRDTNTAPGTTYAYQVEAVNLQHGVGESSAPVETTTSTDDPTDAGWWAFEEAAGTVAADSTAWRRPATLVGDLGWGGGRVGGGVVFDGFDDRADLDPAVMDEASDVTVTFWLQTTKTGEQALVSGANPANDNEYLLMLPTPDVLRLYVGHSSTTGVEWDLGQSVADGQWHHLAVVRDQTRNRVDAYLDGAWVGAWGVTVTLTDLEIDQLVVGQDQDSVGGGYQTAQSLSGGLDELRVFTRVVGAAEIAELAQRDTTPPTAPGDPVAVGYDAHIDVGWTEAADEDSGVSGYQIWRDSGVGFVLQREVPGGQLTWRDTAVRAGMTYQYQVVALNGSGVAGPASATVAATAGGGDGSLVGWWAFDDGSGTVAADWSGRSRDGTLVGGGWAADGLNGAVTLGGGTDGVELDPAVLSGLDDVTMSVWFRTESTARVQALVSGVNTGGDEYLIAFIDQTEVRVYTGESNDSHAKFFVPAVNDGEWHHLVVLRDGAADQVALFVDGVSYGTQNHVLNPLTVEALMLGQEQDTVGGGFDPAQTFVGAIDELRFYDRVLDPDEVAALGGSYAPMIDLVAPATPTGLTATVVDGTVELAWAASTEDDWASYSVYRGVDGAALTELATEVGGASYVDTTVVPGSTHTYAVTAVDLAGNESALSGSVSVTVEAVSETVVVLAGGETTSSGAVTSGSYLSTQADDDVTEVLRESESGGKPDRRVSSLVHEWSFDLGTASSVEIQVDATWNPAGVDGFRFSYLSGSGSGFLPVTGSGGVETFTVSGLTGVVTIRVEDTDRTPGERTLDSVSVDYLAVVASGGGSGGDPGDPRTGDVGVASGENTAFGTVVGTYQDTHSGDGLVEQLTEVAWAGGSRARLEHTWTVAVPGGGAATFGLVAGVDGTESFVFECSVDGSNWIPVQTVAGPVSGTVTFPCSTASSSVLIRVTDTDRSKGDTTLSSITVDSLHLTG